jgi:hypothetical protein
MTLCKYNGKKNKKNFWICINAGTLPSTLTGIPIHKTGNEFSVIFLNIYRLSLALK